MTTVGSKLRDYRLRHGLSKRALAAQLGVSVPTIVRWEAGEAEPTDYNLYKIQRILEADRPAHYETLPLFDPS